MCGIVGVSGSFDPISLGRAVNLLKHRGPDDHGVFVDQDAKIGLGHTRLSILDLSPLGHQPMASNDGKVTLAFNGEIYNFCELRDELKADGHTFSGVSDTEVLLQLYLANRQSDADLAKFLRRLNGIFAFALWDADRDGLLLARDAIGVKPLYYFEGEEHFVFASEIKGLLPLISSIGGLDLKALDRYLSFLWCPGNQTPAQKVKKVDPGELLWVRDGNIVERRFWYKLPMFRSAIGRMSAVEAIAGTEQLLRQAVHRQLVADVPVGAFLSGGLDSSAIVALAREQNSDIQCFTIEATGGPEEGTVDDLPYAKCVAKNLNVPLEVVRVDAARIAKDLESMVAQLDEPLADLAPLNVLYISQFAREHGMKVLLSGAGGDDLFTGYRRHRALMTEGYWSWLPRPLLHGLEHLTANLDQRKTLGRRLRKLCAGAALGSEARLVNYFLWNRREDLATLYTPEFRMALGDTYSATPMLEFLDELPENIPPLERLLALEQHFFLPDHNLIYTDKMSMAAGVEVRVPFLDLDLIEFAARIPSEFKQKGGVGKWVLKKAMERYLPREVIYRPKTGFGAPLRRWMRFELRGMLSDVLSINSLRKRGLFDPFAVQKLIADNDAGRNDASYTLLSLLCIELWCRRFMDNPSSALNS